MECQRNTCKLVFFDMDNVLVDFHSGLDQVREDAHCRLMLRSENSKKSNNTLYQRYDRKKKGVYQMIIVENVDNPVDKKKYKIFRTLNNNFSEVVMQKEK